MDATKTPVDEFKYKLTMLKKNRENIPYEERTGNGRYQKAYARLKTDVESQLSLYCCMQIFCGMSVPDSPDGIRFINETIGELKKNQTEISRMAVSADLEKIDDLLDKIRSNVFETYWMPMANKIIQNGDTVSELFLYNECERQLAALQKGEKNETK